MYLMMMMMMMKKGFLSSLIVLLLLHVGNVWGLATNSAPKGSAAKPFAKQKVAVFGAGGYLGSNIFGYLQRASSIYGTGIGSTFGSPRCICATGMASFELNKVLSKNFKLAFAGEPNISLTNMVDVDAIAKRLKNIDAAVIGTKYLLEQRPITANTYERTPNDKTNEFYLDSLKRDVAVSVEDCIEYNEILFGNTIDACRQANVKHIVVIETPGCSQDFRRNVISKKLNSCSVPFTYIVCGQNWVNTVDHTFEKGLQNNILFKAKQVNKNFEDVMESIESERRSSIMEMAREDIAAVAVQALMSLDWTTSRILCAENNGSRIKIEGLKYIGTKPPKSDKDWCMYSNYLADDLNKIV